MMDTAIVEDDNTLLLGVRVELWALSMGYSQIVSIFDKKSREHTICSWMNVKNCSFVTDPSKMSSATMPSVVSAGRIEYRTPRRNVALCTQGLPMIVSPSQTAIYVKCPTVHDI